jgi:hypothetical protein
MDVDHGLEMNLPRREIRVLLLHEFRLSHKGCENERPGEPKADPHTHPHPQGQPIFRSL